MKNYTIPAAIVIAGALIAGALFISRDEGNNPADPREGQRAVDTEKISPVSGDDHILGDPNAPIVIVEYSDIDCGWCGNFHGTMHDVIEEFGRDGDVAWVYRHFPITQRHPNAPRKAEATECVAELGGNSAFWTFTDTLFEEKTPVGELADAAVEAGVNKTSFESCMESGRHKNTVGAQAAEAVEAGATGTPFFVVIAGGQQVPIEGAQPLPAMRSIIQTILLELRGESGQYSVPAI